jgi:amino acid transporter
VLENTAANSVSLAQNVLDAAGTKVYGTGKTIVISLAANTFSCVLHAISRKWGIRLNNFFGTVKFFILNFIVIIGLICIEHDIARDNFDPKTSFSTANSPRLLYRYAKAFLFVIYPYGAYRQINYIYYTPLEKVYYILTALRSSPNSINHERLFPACLGMEFLRSPFFIQPST